MHGGQQIASGRGGYCIAEGEIRSEVCVTGRKSVTFCERTDILHKGTIQVIDVYRILSVESVSTTGQSGLN